MAKTTTVNASPTKQFFVKMLTRDIDLLDAILDLLDNCVDGVIRSIGVRKKHTPKERPYEHFHAKITANENEFIIEDNCGGIPRKVAEKVAFRLGRPTDEELHELGVEISKQGTVGLYGIGMKRAVFKMGRHAVITSENNDDAFNVKIDPDWLESGDWDLPMEEAEPDGEKGTTIRVTKLYKEISHQFSGDTVFLDNLYDTISQLFAVIINKGFTVHLNGKEIKPVSLRLLVSAPAGDKATISPYVFRGNIKGVDVEVVVGFHRDPSKAASPEGEDEESRVAAVKQAGWSVICNDRLVLYGDRSEMTGWGTRPIPYFHPQYNSIAGIVTMRCDDPAMLPLNTTKRGIEVTGGVYLKVLEYMKDGVKRFIDYTNKWKGRMADTAPQFKSAKPVPVAEIPKTVPKNEYSTVGKSRLADDGGSAEEFKPDLELPKKEVTTRRICFTKPVEEIKELAEGLLDDADAEPSSVGEECFDRALALIRKPRKKS